MTEPRRPPAGHPPGTRLRDLGAKAAEELGELLSAPVERVTGMRKSDHGWTATVEVREMERVPQSSDVMADYEVELTGQGSVTGFRRLRRYLRSELESHRWQ